MGTFNSRPRSHGYRRGETGSTDERGSAIDEDVGRADRHFSAASTHRNIGHASKARFAARNDRQRTRSCVGLPEGGGLKIAGAAATEIGGRLEIVGEVGIG